MKNKYQFKYPDINPLLTALPEEFQCPECDTFIEIWTDETGGKCTSCDTYYKNMRLAQSSGPTSTDLNKRNEKLKKLIEEAHKSGASEVAVVSTKDIIVENDLADMCREPQCENYGLSRSCPPFVPGPSAFKKLLQKFNQAIFFKIDVPSEILYSSEGREIFQLLHEIAAGIETAAVNMGFANAQA